MFYLLQGSYYQSCILAILINHNIISIVIFAYKIPELFTDKKFIICKKLPYTTLFPHIALSVSVICGSKIYAYTVFRAKSIGKDTILFKQCFFLRTGLFIVKVAANLELYKIMDACSPIYKTIIAFMSLAVLATAFLFQNTSIVAYLGLLVGNTLVFL